MEVRSTYKYARISPLKARDVARVIQGLPVSQAIDVLTFTPRKAAALVNKTLKAAVANAENNHDLSADALVVKEAVVSKGPAFRRFKARARGSASAIRKPTSHIFITVTDEVELPEPRKRASAAERKKRRARRADLEQAVDALIGGGAAAVAAAAAVVAEPAEAAEVQQPEDAVAFAEEEGGAAPESGADEGADEETREDT